MRKLNCGLSEVIQVTPLSATITYYEPETCPVTCSTGTREHYQVLTVSSCDDFNILTSHSPSSLTADVTQGSDCTHSLSLHIWSHTFLTLLMTLTIISPDCAGTTILWRLMRRPIGTLHRSGTGACAQLPRPYFPFLSILPAVQVFQPKD